MFLLEEKIENVEFDMDPNIDENLKNLILALLKKEPKERLGNGEGNLSF